MQQRIYPAFVIGCGVLSFIIGWKYGNLECYAKDASRTAHSLRHTKSMQVPSLPGWVDGGPTVMTRGFIEGSGGQTDKTTTHKYQYMYHRYLSQMVRRKFQSYQQQQKQQTIVMLEIGLGCGDYAGKPGGGVGAWMHFLNVSGIIKLELHSMEFNEKCGTEWAKKHLDVHFHVGDQSNKEDLLRVVKSSSKSGFDIIVDDGSHVNSHQIFTLESLYPFLLPGGVYVIEDIQNSCDPNRGGQGYENWGGAYNCTGPKDKLTLFGKVVEWQKSLVVGGSPFKGLNHIDLNFESVVFEKEL